MTSQTFRLYHSLSGTNVEFTPIVDGHLAGKVSVQTTYANKNWSTETCEPQKARALWSHWLALGAYDLRKWAIVNGQVFKREAGGNLSCSIIVSRYDYANEFANKYAPKGYQYCGCEYLDRDDEMDHDEDHVALHYSPIAHSPIQ